MSIIAKIQTKNGSVSAVTYNNKQLKTTHIIQEALDSLYHTNATYLHSDYEIQLLDNKKVMLISKGYIFSREIECGQEVIHDQKVEWEISSQKIQKAIERQFAFEIVTKPKHLPVKPVKKTIAGKFVGLAKTALLEKVLHAKICDIAVLAFFGLAIVLIMVHNPAILYFAHILMPISSTVFGIINSTLVGPMILIQALKNAKKAIDMNDKKELALAIIGILSGVLIITFGIVSITAISNVFLFRSLLALGTVFGLTFASYKFYRTISLKRDFLQAPDLRSFFNKRIQISEAEQDEIEKRINSYSDDQINKRLKMFLSKIKFKEIQERTSEEKRKLLLLTELETLQKRKIDNMQSILRAELTNRCITFLNNSNISDEEEKQLKKDILKELKRRQIVEIIRATATLVSAGAYPLNMSSVIANSSLSNIVYNAMLFTSKGIAAPLNYVKAYRNVETKKDDNKITKVAYDYLIPSASAA